MGANIDFDVLMYYPESFRIEDAINDHMNEQSTVDSKEALRQWIDYREKLGSAGLEVEVLSSDGDFQDKVFTANHGFVTGDMSRRKVLLSNMSEQVREPEIDEAAQLLEEKGLETLGPTESSFEGSGDLMEHPEEEKLWMGYGFRTDRSAAEEIENLTGLEVEPLELSNPLFYHLDTCFEHIDTSTAMLVPEALREYQDVERFYNVYEQVIEVPNEEAEEHLAGNSYCPDGQNVFVPEGAEETSEKLKDEGYTAVPVDLSEFHLSGGSAYCMKLDCRPVEERRSPH